VQLIYYDDQSNPATVPGIFTKLLDVDKVDLVTGDYGTNLLAPAMPVVIQHKLTFFALFGLDVNREFQYPRYFSIAAGRRLDPRSVSRRASSKSPRRRPQAANPRDHRGRRRIPRNAPKGRARMPGRRAQNSLRQDLPADHDRLHADRAGDRPPTPMSC